jgi:hypothetical protein
VPSTGLDSPRRRSGTSGSRPTSASGSMRTSRTRFPLSTSEWPYLTLVEQRKDAELTRGFRHDRSEFGGMGGAGGMPPGGMGGMPPGMMGGMGGGSRSYPSYPPVQMFLG